MEYYNSILFFLFKLLLTYRYNLTMSDMHNFYGTILKLTNYANTEEQIDIRANIKDQKNLEIFETNKKILKYEIEKLINEIYKKSFAKIEHCASLGNCCCIIANFDIDDNEYTTDRFITLKFNNILKNLIFQTDMIEKYEIPYGFSSLKEKMKPFKLAIEQVVKNVKIIAYWKIPETA